MAGRRHKPEEIIGKLREAEIVLAQGGTVPDACRRIGVTEQTYYRWRKEYGGLKVDQAQRLKELERENARLRRAVSDLMLDKLILQEAARGAEDRRSQTIEPRAPATLHRPHPGDPARIRAAGVPGARAAPIDGNARSRAGRTTNWRSPRTSSPWHGSMAAMAIGVSRRCGAMRAGR